MWYKIVQALINKTLRETIYLPAVFLLIGITNSFDHIYGQTVPTLKQCSMFDEERNNCTQKCLNVYLNYINFL